MLYLTRNRASFWSNGERSAPAVHVDSDDRSFGRAAQVGGSGSPFDTTLNSLLSFAQRTFVKIAAILAVNFGGWQAIGGDGHGKRALGGLIVGVGLMVYAAPLVTWLFP